jgi:hypothetical protein
MIQTISKVPPRSQLLCIWLVTGDPRRPLTCRWMEGEIPFLTPFRPGAVTGTNDTPEKKCSTAGRGSIAMTRPVRTSLAVLRGSLVLMTLMLGYHVLDMAGILRHVR